jgi:tagatose 6-phosphate kinase
MILTITPDAHIERTFVVEGLRLGSVLKAEQEVVMPAGTGVSISLVLKELRAQTLAAGLVSGFNGDYFLDLLDHLYIPNQFSRCSGETPTAFHLVEFDRRRETNTSSNTMFGLPEHADQLAHLLQEHADEVTGVILGGSLISGLPLNSFRRLIEDVRSLKRLSALHATGRGLKQALDARPDLLRLTREDLSQLDPDFADLSQPVPSLAAKLKAKLGVWAEDAIMVLLASHVALAVTREGVFQAVAEEVPFVNRSGVEEAFTAGVTLAYLQSRSWKKALSLGMAAASATILQVGKAVCRRKDVDSILPTVEVKALA